MYNISMQEDLQTLKNQAIADLTHANTQDDLERVKTEYLGRSGKLAEITKQLKTVPQEERKQVGILLNDVKTTITLAYEEQASTYKQKGNQINDPTMPGIQPEIGSLHLVTQAIQEISDVFKQIGFSRVRYPEVEWDWFSFEALNFDKLHPARDDWETFFVDTKPHKTKGPMLLTPHTSSGQVREMLRIKNPPIRMINIAKCYRRQSDVSHTQMFHQFEGLVIDKGITISNLKGTLTYFAKMFFGEDREIRLRPYNFPFTEPSFEVDISCDICNGKGCRLCKEGWLELAGAGMVHPNVLRHGGIDPNEYTGFAFGAGVERVLMMKSGLKVPDLRLLYSTDLRFLRQF